MRAIELPSNSTNEMLDMSTGPLKLVALDPDDLKILSAHLQDAVIRLADMVYMPADQHFAAILSRFDWLSAENGDGRQSNLRRCRCALRFDKIKRAQVQKVRLGDKFAVVELLAITFDELETPGGYITLHFAGGGAVRLEVECIEAELHDVGEAWRASCKPQHKVLEASEAQLPAETVQTTK
jgi:Protein of unknown function (DUF2948)